MFPDMGGPCMKRRGYKIREQSFKTQVHKNLLLHTVVNLWNCAPQKIVETRSMETFDEEVDIFF